MKSHNDKTQKERKKIKENERKFRKAKEIIKDYKREKANRKKGY